MRASAVARRTLVQALLGLAALGLAPRVHGEDLPEYRLKAAFLYNFAAFTEWPAEVGGTLNLCIFGADPFGAEIDPLNGKKVGERSLAVHRKTALDSLKGCQIVFVPGAALGQLPRVLDTLHGQPVLTVAESPGAVQQGAMLSMSVAQGRIKFDANLKAARGAKLDLSSKLLRLATEVVQ